jgi:lysophospholipase L1-like esterase
MMSIQNSDGPIKFDNSDWQHTHDGVTFGVKIRFVPLAYLTVAMLCEKTGDTWQPVANVDMDMSAATDVDAWIAMAAGIVNVWAASRFPDMLPVTVTPSTRTSGTVIEQIDAALRLCLHIKSLSITEGGGMMRRIAVIGDSISTRNNGSSADAWPHLLGSMIESMGVFDISVRNYSLPGLTFATALMPTDGWLIGGALSPVEAVLRDGADLVIVCMGVNDRENPSAGADALALRDALTAPVMYARQEMVGNGSIVTNEQQGRMNAVYAELGGDGFTLNLGKLYEMGMTYDGLHPTNSGKQWIAAGCYAYLQQYLPLSKISRNIAWLHNQNDDVQCQMIASCR